MSFKHDVDGRWLQLPMDLQHAVNYIVNHYVIDDKHQNNDGSIGTVKITPKELMDLIASFIIPGGEDDTEEDDA